MKFFAEDERSVFHRGKADLTGVAKKYNNELNQQVNKVKRMLNSFIQKLTANR